MSEEGVIACDLDQVVHLVDSVADALARLGRVAIWKLAPEGLDEVSRRLETATRLGWAAQVNLAGEYEAQHVAKTRGCSSTAAMLAKQLGIGPGEAWLRVRTAGQVLPQDLPDGGEAPPQLPLLAQALAAGEISSEHCRIIERSFRGMAAEVTPEARAGFEKSVVEHAKVADPTSLDTLATNLRNRLEQELEPKDRPDPKDRAELTVGRRDHATGLTPFHGRLEDYGIELLTALFDKHAGPKPAGDIPDLRPAPTRQAHALTDALEHLLGCREDHEGGHGRPTIDFTLDWDVLQQQAGALAMSGRGRTLSATETRRLLCEAEILPVVMNGDGVPLDLGRSQRTANRALRRALAHRDRGCAFPGCDRPPAWCHAHHIDFWGRDLGPTSLHNGALLCGFHHQLIHREAWRIRMNPVDQLPDFIPPAWLDPGQRPRRNTSHPPWPRTGAG
ncbi:DUF222 domain-containing protein [Nakamurella sp. YIM 132087]|uniref:DUF222 domain-containing protein n=1 Tax=Nakamurella alba TaxID=2665158 RepID=A0A7K1FET5_9ACTN|nr:HNH endonuclease signature motif containing protein [Nakamurella alba]MTD12617.1 DUF222 domain-containing protein [Nakamurella alba]